MRRIVSLLLAGSLSFATACETALDPAAQKQAACEAYIHDHAPNGFVLLKCINVSDVSRNELCYNYSAYIRDVAHNKCFLMVGCGNNRSVTDVNCEGLQ